MLELYDNLITKLEKQKEKYYDKIDAINTNTDLEKQAYYKLKSIKPKKITYADFLLNNLDDYYDISDNDIDQLKNQLEIEEARKKYKEVFNEGINKINILEQKIIKLNTEIRQININKKECILKYLSVNFDLVIKNLDTFLKKINTSDATHNLPNPNTLIYIMPEYLIKLTPKITNENNLYIYIKYKTCLPLVSTVRRLYNKIKLYNINLANLFVTVNNTNEESDNKKINILKVQIIEMLNLIYSMLYSCVGIF